MLSGVWYLANVLGYYFRVCGGFWQEGGMTMSGVMKANMRVPAPLRASVEDRLPM